MTPPDRDAWLRALAEQVARGEYRLDPELIARALLRRMSPERELPRR